MRKAPSRRLGLAWVEEESGKLAEALVGSMKQIHAEIASAVADVLGPVLCEIAHARAMEELAAVVKTITSSKDVLEIEVKAPADLLEAVKNVINGEQANVSFHEQATGEVEVRLDASQVRTKLGQWRQLHFRGSGMSVGEEDTAQQPIIIVRRSGGHDDGHHGGVWKIAFADFMTALMAFFLVMWLVNAANRETKRMVASYFNPLKLSDTITAPKGLKKLQPGEKSDASQEKPANRGPSRKRRQDGENSAAQGDKKNRSPEGTSETSNPSQAASERQLKMSGDAELSSVDPFLIKESEPATKASGLKEYGNELANVAPMVAAPERIAPPAPSDAQGDNVAPTATIASRSPKVTRATLQQSNHRRTSHLERHSQRPADAEVKQGSAKPVPGSAKPAAGRRKVETRNCAGVEGRAAFVDGKGCNR